VTKDTTITVIPNSAASAVVLDRAVLFSLQGHRSFDAAVRAWYSEESGYNYNGGGGAGHFTQMVSAYAELCLALHPDLAIELQCHTMAPHSASGCGNMLTLHVSHHVRSHDVC
jgi:hypothetical protein